MAEHFLHDEVAGPVLAGPRAAVGLAHEVVDAVRVWARALQLLAHLGERVPRQP